MFYNPAEASTSMVTTAIRWKNSKRTLRIITSVLCLSRKTTGLTVHHRSYHHHNRPSLLKTRLAVSLSPLMNELEHQQQLDNDHDDSNERGSRKHNEKREIVGTASITLPFSANIAFDAFADLTRQPSWSTWLRSVKYITSEDDNNYLAENKHRETEWRMGWGKFTFGWNAKSTKLERPRIIQWESTKGLKNSGCATFTENYVLTDEVKDYNDDDTIIDDANMVNTTMILTVKFIAPRIVARALGRSSKVEAFMNRLLMGTLTSFQEVVTKEDLQLKL